MSISFLPSQHFGLHGHFMDMELIVKETVAPTKEVCELDSLVMLLWYHVYLKDYFSTLKNRLRCYKPCTSSTCILYLL